MSVFIVLNARDEIKSKYPSIICLSIYSMFIAAPFVFGGFVSSPCLYIYVVRFVLSNFANISLGKRAGCFTFLVFFDDM